MYTLCISLGAAMWSESELLEKILLKQDASIDLHSLFSEACAVRDGAHLPAY